MKKRKIFLVVLFLLLLVELIIINTEVIANYEDDIIKPVEYSDEYKEYLNLSEEDKQEILQPRMYDIPKYEDTSEIVTATFEPRYSLKDVIPDNVIVKSQGKLGVCWAFATLSSLETNLALNNIGSIKRYDFSERHMDYALSNIFATQFNREPGSGITGYKLTSPNIKTIAYLTNGTGAVNEADMPFKENSDRLDISEIKNKTATTQVFDTIDFPSYSITEDTTRIKQQIKEHIKKYGAVKADIHGAQPYTDWYNMETGAIYCDDEKTCKVNHAVSIIGWDDNYSINKFNERHRPKKSGAWIIKNSWGTDIGDNGLMYVSYEDVNIYKNLFGIIKASDHINYENIYQYDEIGLNGNSFISGKKVYIGQIFNKKTTDIEYLTQVSIFAPERYKCKVYVNPNGTNMEKSALKEVALEAGETETIDPGYHTLEFLKPIKLAGNDFVVVIEILVEEGEIGAQVAVEVNNNADAKVEFQNSLQTAFGKCFVTNEEKIERNEWIDRSIPRDPYYPEYCDTSIKAFTVSSIENQTYTVNFDYKLGTGTLKSKEVENGETYGELPVATRVGYTFGGWYTSDNKKIESTTNVNLTTDITLIAKWIPNKYKVTFKSEGTTILTKQVIYDQVYGSLPVTVREGYIFKGWYTPDNKKIESTEKVKITSDIVMTAKWEKEAEEGEVYIRSKKYNIEDNYSGDKYLNKIGPGTTVREFIENCETNGNIKVLNLKGEEVKETDLVGTNMKIRVTKNREKIELTAIVMGDVDGNGKVTATDLSTVNQTVLGLIDLKGVLFKAADLDGNKSITATDLSTVNQIVLNVIKLTYDKIK